MGLNRKPITEEEARLKMAGICAGKEQCRFDISQKLYRLGIIGDQRENILSFLEKERFIDHERYSRSFSRDKCRFSGWGPYKIRMALRAKRIEESVISGALEEIPSEEWEETAMKCGMSKAKSLDLNGDESRENRMKVFRYLLGKGFDVEMSKRVVKEVARKQRENNA